jgi:ubiquitin C-terminal hydrolase
MKTNAKISYEHLINLQEYTHDKQEHKYELYSAIRHHGGMRGGHYYTYSKSPMNSEWYLYDDDDVFHVPKDEVLKCNGYVLFYRKC